MCGCVPACVGVRACVRAACLCVCVCVVCVCVCVCVCVVCVCVLWCVCVWCVCVCVWCVCVCVCELTEGRHMATEKRRVSPADKFALRSGKSQIKNHVPVPKRNKKKKGGKSAKYHTLEITNRKYVANKNVNTHQVSFAF